LTELPERAIHQEMLQEEAVGSVRALCRDAPPDQPAGEAPSLFSATKNSFQEFGPRVNEREESRLMQTPAACQTR
jgi:hypothetical protein